MTPSPAQVSVITPCRGEIAYLAQALAGLAEQTVAWELLFVDVGSSDGSREVVEAFAEHHPVRILDAPAGTSPGVARNMAVARASTRWVAFLDADDVWRADKLERQLALMESTGAVLVFSDCRVVDATGSVLGSYLARHRPARGDVWRHLLHENFVATSTVVLRREAYERAGGSDEGFRVASDYLLYLRLARTGSFELDPDPLTDYRIHPGSLTDDYRGVYAENVRLFDVLLEEERDPLERDRIRRGKSRVLWRWALREMAGGPSGWSAAGHRAKAAWSAAGSGGGAVATLLAAARSWTRGIGLRLRMRRARGVRA